MGTSYLFRIDGAKENDDFFAAVRSAANIVYAGVDLPLCAAGWAPDFVTVTIEEPPDRGSLTLIELEATESAARVSCRKYLPENPADILAAFTDYLDRVIRKCRTTADHRESELIRLRRFLSATSDVTITTAGALRSSTEFLEELPLIQQPSAHEQPRAVQETTRGVQQPTFHGVLRLSAREAKALGRCVKIVDAVIRECDHSNGTMHSWRNKAPLKRLLRDDNGNHPTLRKLLFGVFQQQNRGLTIDFDTMLVELVDIWSAACGLQLDREHIRSLVSSYYPAALSISSYARMSDVFDLAREYVSVDDLTAAPHVLTT